MTLEDAAESARGGARRVERADAERLAREALRRWGLERWEFAFNRRTTSFGLCRFDRRRIELSARLLPAMTATEVRDTVLHEVAHALAGPRAGHGPRWRAAARRVGAPPERCARPSAAVRKRVDAAARWRVLCRECGAEVARRQRRPTRLVRRYRCRGCGGGLRAEPLPGGPDDV